MLKKIYNNTLYERTFMDNPTLPEILDNQEESLEQSKLREEYIIARNVLSECINKKILSKRITEDYLSDILKKYAYLKSLGKEQALDNILRKYQFNYITSIKYAIYLTLNNNLSKINPLYLPGIYNIKKDNNKYIFTTTLGNLAVYKASTLFKSTIFNKQLTKMCYERTLNFLLEDPSFKAILSYQPNYFNWGHFHAYLKKDNNILDIANNAFYYEYPINFFSKTISSLSLDDINKEYAYLTKYYSYPKYYKLHTLTLYHTYKDSFKI